MRTPRHSMVLSMSKPLIRSTIATAIGGLIYLAVSSNQAALALAAEKVESKDNCEPIKQAVRENSVQSISLSPQSSGQAASTEPMVNQLSVLEQKLYSRGYDCDGLDKRLSRLEISVFGELPAKLADQERLARLLPAFAKKEEADTKQALAERSIAGANLEAKKKRDKETYLTWYEKAGKDIRLRRYKAAASELLESIKLNPRFPRSYAYMGDVLLKLNDREGAREAYKACFEVDPFGTYGRYGKAKLLGLVRQEAYYKPGAQDSDKVVSHTIKTINRQVGDMTQRIQRDSENVSSWKTALATIAQRRMLQSMQEARVQGGGRRGTITTYYPGGGERHEMSDLSIMNNYYMQTDWVRQNYLARAEAARKAAFVNESAANLKAQMLQPLSPGGTRLRALGTNLYVRYYGDDNPSIVDPPVPEDPEIELTAKSLAVKSLHKRNK